MCGIAGTLSFDPAAFRVTDDLVTRMRDTIAHRGPDGAATWVAADGRDRARLPAARDHRPLRGGDAADAERGRRPSGIVFNGEIYNHAEIRPRARAARPRLPHRPLRHRGDRPRLRGVGHRRACTGFRGMFAFAALGRARRASSGSCATASASSRSTGRCHHGRLTLRLRDQGAARRIPQQERARRRGGALPLPLVPHDAGAADALPRHPQARRRNLAARRPRTATRARSATGTRGTSVEPLDGVSEDEIAERVLDELRTSVRLRKVSDVPVGVFLSGGIDSSTNAALFSEGETQPDQDVLDRLRGRLLDATRTSSTTRG